MIQSFVGYCRCGCEIWIEYLWTGAEWIYRYFDLDSNEITKCPECGRELSEEELESRETKSNQTILLQPQ